MQGLKRSTPVALTDVKTSPLRILRLFLSTEATFRPTNIPVSKLSRDGIRQLEAWSKDFLHPLKTPLGTISDWNEALKAIKSYIGDRYIPRYVDTADRILNRLLLEYYCRGSMVAQRDLLEDPMRSVILSWFNLSQEYPDATLGIHRAESLCGTLDEWGLVTDTERLALLSLKQQVITTELETKNFLYAPDFCLQVAQQLLKYDASNVVPALDSIFRVAVDQTLKIAAATENSDMTTTVSELLQRINDLAEVGLLTPFPEDELDQIIDSLYMEGNSSSSPSSLSAYERKALHRRILTKIGEMGENDAEAVDELINNWRTNVQSNEITEWKPFAQVVTNFYLLIQDPYKATKWMQIQQQIPTPEELLEALEQQSRRVTHDDKDAEFEELKALEKVFSDNESERIRQKLNLLNIWAEQVRSPITPWRVTEILESLENEEGADLDATLYMTVLRLWLNESPASSRRAVSIALRSPSYPPALIMQFMDLLMRQDQQDKGSATASAISLADIVEENFDSLPEEDVLPLAEGVSNLLMGTERLQKLVAFLVNHDVQVSEPIVQAAVKSLRDDTNEENVLKLLNVFDKLPGLDHTAYDSAIQWLLNRQDDVSFDLASKLLIQLFELQPENALDTLKRMFNNKKASKLKSALDFLDAIEKKIFVNENAVKTPAPIPLAFYKEFLSWAAGVPKHFTDLMQKLQNHYENGWADLHPDAEMTRKYMYMLHQNRQTLPYDVTDIRAELLERLIERYELTDCTEDAWRPSYIMFDWVVGDLKLRNKTLKEDDSSETDPFAKDSRRVVALVEKIRKCRIDPEDVKRPFVFNAAMEMVLSCRNQHMHFRTIMVLKKQMIDLGVKPNIHTVVVQLRACALASKSSHRRAYWGWHSMVVALNEARMLKVADERVYNLCFKAMYANRGASLHKVLQKEKILEAVAQTAIVDGYFDSNCRYTFLALANEATKRRMFAFLKAPNKDPSHQLANMLMQRK